MKSYGYNYRNGDIVENFPISFEVVSPTLLRRMEIEEKGYQNLTLT